jgi:hypothetical protein
MEAHASFASLIHRPPTPPKDNEEKAACDSALSMLSANLLPYDLNTPDESPNSSVDYIEKSPDKGTKRVDFVSTPTHIENIETSAGASIQHSRERRPRRSILKSSSHLFSSDPISSDPVIPEERDFPTMLEDMIRGLASPDTSTRFDAYLAINGCRKTYIDTPSKQALIDKMPLLADFITRDLSETNVEDGVRSSQLVTEAIKLATTLCWSREVQESMPPKFQSFLINHSISVISKETTAKTLANNYLFMLSTQSFPSKVVSNEKATRLLAALGGITKRITGRQVIAHRLMIYKRLINQAKTVMVSKFEDWIEDLFQGLLSSTKDIRIRAVDLGFTAAEKLGSEESVSKRVLEFLNKEVVEGEQETRYLNQILGRFIQWLDAKQETSHITDVWSIVTLFLRSKARYVERLLLEQIKPKRSEKEKLVPGWLKVIQACFNSGDTVTKCKANRAWMRLIFSISPDATTHKDMASMLPKPLKAQMERFKSPQTEAEDVRKCVYGAYYALLYHALRPGSDVATLDRYWEAYVVSIFARKGKPLLNPTVAARIMQTLFSGPDHRPWISTRVLDEKLIEPEELPRIDSKWVRSKIKSILSLLEQAIVEESWWKVECPLFLNVWKSLMNALRVASSKEIKASLDTMMAMAEITKLFKKYLESASTPEDVPIRIERYSLLLQDTRLALGPLPFLEKRLFRSSENVLEATDTPSSRLNKPKGSLISPLFCLIEAIMSLVSNSTLSIFDLEVCRLLDISIEQTKLDETRIRALRETASYISEFSFSPCATDIFWNKIIKETTLTVKNYNEPTEANDHWGTRGQLYREVVKLLDILSHQEFETKFTIWNTSLQQIVQHIQDTTGIGGVVLAAVEPISNSLNQQLDSEGLDKTIDQINSLIDIARWPTSKKDMDIGQTKLWRSDSTKKETKFKVFEHFYTLVSKLLSMTYECNNSQSMRSQLGVILSSISQFIKSCPSSEFSECLRKIQHGIYGWIEDREKVLDTQTTDSKQLWQEVVQLWCCILRKIQDLERHDSELLQTLAIPLTAGFTSKHRAIVNKSIIIWNATFGKADNLTYPDPLRQALIKLASIADIELPGIAKQDLESVSTVLEFADTPEDLEEPENVEGKPTMTTTKSPILKSRPIVRVETPERRPNSKRSTAGERTTPRLRHDNSQIEFAAIDSSPSILGAIDSQFLTERQKEVQERQHREAAAMFPDLSSNSKPKQKEPNTPRLQLSERDRAQASDGIDNQESPTLPTTENMTEFLGSSPTPSQRRSSSRDSSKMKRVIQPPNPKNDDDPPNDPPSSPPVIEPNIDNQVLPSDATEELADLDLEEIDNDKEQEALLPEEDRMQEAAGLEIQEIEQQANESVEMDYSSDHDEQILSQIAQELKHASQDVIVVVPAETTSFVAHSNQASPRNGGTSKRRRSIHSISEHESDGETTRAIKRRRSPKESKSFLAADKQTHGSGSFSTLKPQAETDAVDPIPIESRNNPSSLGGTRIKMFTQNAANMHEVKDASISHDAKQGGYNKARIATPELPHSKLSDGLEKMLIEARKGIDSQEASSIMRMTMELMQIAMSSIEGKKSS